MSTEKNYLFLLKQDFYLTSQNKIIKKFLTLEFNVFCLIFCIALKKNTLSSLKWIKNIFYIFTKLFYSQVKLKKQTMLNFSLYSPN